MKFKLRQAAYWCDTETKNKLSKLGFRFMKETEENITYREWYCDNDIDPTIEINTIEELMQFIEEYGRIVIDGDEILIYNDHIE